MKIKTALIFIFMSGLLLGQGFTLLIDGEFAAVMLIFGSLIPGLIGAAEARKWQNVQED